MQSEQTDKINAALAKAQTALTSPPRNRTVTVRGSTKAGKAFSYDFRYATLDSIIELVRKPLTDNGLWFVQTVDGEMMVTRLVHSSGQWIDSAIPLVLPANREPQAIGSALTYCKRYGLCAALGLAADEDDDANAAEGNEVTAQMGGRASEQASEPWRGPVKMAALKQSVRDHGHHVAGMDESELVAWLGTDEYKALVIQLRHDLPEWWEGDGKQSIGLKGIILKRLEELGVFPGDVPPIEPEEEKEAA